MLKEDIVSKIKNFNIVQVISNYLKLKKINSKQYKGNCPFHKEKTPSFFVDIDGYYKCFGCNKGGDVINFVQEVEKIPFKDAVDKICLILGIENKKEIFVPSNVDNIKRLIDLNNKLAEFFHKRLFLKENEEVLEYLTKVRKLNINILKKFKIGYCNCKITDITQALNINEEDLIALSIIKKTQFGSRLFFEDRITIPIFDKKGNVISFGGRVYKEENLNYKPMKYLNGANNQIFHKSSVLFNLNNVLGKRLEKLDKNNKETSEIQNPLIVVEGYMDAISLEKNNIRSVASLGTSLSVEQLRMIFSIDKKPYFCYDSDNAGKMATFNICKRILEIIETGVMPKFISLEYCKDLDEFLNKFERVDFDNLLINAKDFVDYIFDFLLKDYNLKNPNEKSLFEKKLDELLKEIKDKTLQKNYLFHCKNKIFSLLLAKKNNTKLDKFNSISKLNFKNKNILVSKLASFLLQNPKFKLDERIYEILKEDNENYQTIVDVLNDDISKQAVEKLKNEYIFTEDLDYVFNSIINSLKLENLKSSNLILEENKKKIARKNILLKKIEEE